MKFYDYPSIYSYGKKYARRCGIEPNKSFESFYPSLILGVSEPTHKDHALAELYWYRDGQPYYNVWPGVLSAFEKLDLSKVPSDSIKFPTNTLAIRFPESVRLEEFEFNNESFWLRSLLVCKLGIPNRPDRKHETLLLVLYDFGETEAHVRSNEDSASDCSVVSWMRLPLTSGKTVANAIEEAPIIFDSAKFGVQPPRRVSERVIKIVTACGLLENDSSIIIPDVLAKDKHRFDPANPDPVLIERAKRKGKFGWDVGEALSRGSMSPHFRAPHAALYHVGKGRTQTVIRFRTGEGGGPIIVHRSTMTQIPTGRISEEEEKDQ